MQAACTDCGAHSIAASTYPHLQHTVDAILREERRARGRGRLGRVRAVDQHMQALVRLRKARGKRPYGTD